MADRKRGDREGLGLPGPTAAAAPATELTPGRRRLSGSTRIDSDSDTRLGSVSSRLAPAAPRRAEAPRRRIDGRDGRGRAGGPWPAMGLPSPPPLGRPAGSGPGWAGLGRAGPGRVGPGRTGPGRAVGSAACCGRGTRATAAAAAPRTPTRTARAGREPTGRAGPPPSGPSGGPIRALCRRTGPQARPSPLPAALAIRGRFSTRRSDAGAARGPTPRPRAIRVHCTGTSTGRGRPSRRSGSPALVT
jgi:hypothetical protein